MFLLLNKSVIGNKLQCHLLNAFPIYFGGGFFYFIFLNFFFPPRRKRPRQNHFKRLTSRWITMAPSSPGTMQYFPSLTSQQRKKWLQIPQIFQRYPQHPTNPVMQRWWSPTPIKRFRFERRDLIERFDSESGEMMMMMSHFQNCLKNFITNDFWIYQFSYGISLRGSFRLVAFLTPVNMQYLCLLYREVIKNF